MEKKIVMVYKTPVGDISYVVNQLSPLRDAQESVNQEFGAVVRCIAERPYHANGSLPDWCYVRFVPCADDVQMDGAVKKYFTIAGLPYKVSSDSDFDCVNRILAEYGKKTKWTFRGCVFGRSIVNL